ncbi:Protein FRG1 [Trinorchestia longiramus]|nr:Protein FRG1 [Trinorchestia longiramus]
MSAEYHKVKTGKLRLKGEKVKKHKSKKRKHDEEGSGSKSDQLSSFDVDMREHGGWWKTSATHEIKGNIAIQVGNGPVYVRAMDNGLFALGPPHDEGDGPSPEEVLTSLPTGDSHKVAFKSGYGKFVGIDGKGKLVGRTEAMGPREMFTPVYENGETALLCANDCFMGVDDEDNIIAASSAVGATEKVTIRSNTVRGKDKKNEIPEEQGTLKDIEKNYVKKFQKFQDKRLRLNTDGTVELKEARDKGSLHEALLDRRSKMKADRYCK